MWNILCLLLGVVASYFNDLSYKANLANILYDFDIKYDKEDKKQKIEKESKLFNETTKMNDPCTKFKT